MFACIHSRFVSTPEAPLSATLVGLAFTFSPLVEQTTNETVVFDISGQDLLFGHSSISAEAGSGDVRPATNVAAEIVRRANELSLKINVACAATPDVAIHAARAWKTMVIKTGDELQCLGSLSIKHLDFSLVGIDAQRAEEIRETFSLWGIRTFSDLARLPLAGVAERLGQDGVRLQKLAQGKTDRRLNLIRPPKGFEQSLELEHAVTELEPLTFILSRLLNQLCANLMEYALATNELRVTLQISRRSEYQLQSGLSENRTEVGKLDPADLHERSITLPVPVQNPKTLLRLLLFDIEAQPPRAPITAVAIRAEPVKPRASQAGLFIPLAPEPEKLEITLARLAKLVGAEHVGSPELLDTHRPDAFRLNRFTVISGRKHRKTSNRQSAIANRQYVMGFRIFRPPCRADVQTNHGRPVRISTRETNSGNRVRGKIDRASGPWRGSGGWWRPDLWARDEWDVTVIDANQDEVLCRIYRDLISDEWFMAGIYD